MQGITPGVNPNQPPAQGPQGGKGDVPSTIQTAMEGMQEALLTFDTEAQGVSKEQTAPKTQKSATEQMQSQGVKPGAHLPTPEEAAAAATINQTDETKKKEKSFYFRSSCLVVFYK